MQSGSIGTFGPQEKTPSYTLSNYNSFNMITAPCESFHRPDPLPRQEASFAKLPGVVKTRVGYTGGLSPNPTYGSVCAGDGHTEALRIWYDPAVVSYEELLKVRKAATAFPIYRLMESTLSTIAGSASAVWSAQFHGNACYPTCGT
jgi:hypothetical protein